MFDVFFVSFVFVLKMLTNVLRTLVDELFLEIFYEKIIKQLIALTVFNIFHKNGIKFLI